MPTFLQKAAALEWHGHRSHGSPIIYIEGPLDFGLTQINRPVTISVLVQNPGTAKLVLTSLMKPASVDPIGWSPPITILPSGSFSFDIQLNSATPLDLEDQGAYLRIINNSDQPFYQLDLYGIVEQDFWIWDNLNSGSFAAGTRATDEYGNLVITDSVGALSLANDELTMAALGAAATVKLVAGASVARAAGQVLAIKVNNTGVASAFQLGWASASNGTTILHGLNFQNTAIRSWSSFPTLDDYLDDCFYWLAVVLRATGAYFFVRGAWFGHWNLIHVDRDTTTTPLWGVLQQGSLTPVKTFHHFLEPKATLSMSSFEIASDSFNRANGAVGNSDNYAGGTSLAWTVHIGTAAIVSNALGWTVIATIGVLTIEASKASVTLLAAITRVAGEVGIVFRFVDINNFLVGYHDGTNLRIGRMLAGFWTANLATKVVTHAPGAELVLCVDHEEATLVYNKIQLSTTPFIITDSVFLNGAGTRHGLYSTSTSNTVDNFEILPRGSDAGEYNASLAPLAQRLEEDKIALVCIGDSHTQGQAASTAYPKYLLDNLGRGNYDGAKLGISGQTMAQVYAKRAYRSVPLGTGFAVSIAVIWLGTNDLTAGGGSRSGADIYAEMLTLCQDLQVNYTHVLVLTSMPRLSITGGQETQRLTLNSLITTNFPGLGFHVVDVAGNSNYQNINNTTYFLGDKTHLTAVGYQGIASMVQAVIATL